MSPISVPSTHECRLLLEVLLAEDHSALVGMTQAPLSSEDFQLYLQKQQDKTLEHCIEFLEWLVDYTVRFSKLAHDLQQRSPPARGDRVEMSSVQSTVPGIRYGLSPPGKQPFRSAADFCQLRFLNPGAPLDLRMPLGIRDTSLALLARTTHPSAFAGVADHCRRRLASEALPKYVSSACRNINQRSVRTRNIWCALGITLVIAAILTTVLLGWSRWIRFALVPFIFYIIFTLLGSHLSLCFFRYLKGIRDDSGYDGDAHDGSDHQSGSGNGSNSPLDDIDDARRLESGLCPAGGLETVPEVNETEEEKSVVVDEEKSGTSVDPAKVSLDGETKYSGSIHRLSSITTRLPSLDYIESDPSIFEVEASSAPTSAPSSSWSRWMFWRRRQQVEPKKKQGYSKSFEKMPTDSYKRVVRSSLVRRLQRRQILRNVIPMSIITTLMFSAALLAIPETIFD
ncbi:hypothetical protein BDF22DRAFT_663945 [Syncephalis plumigaleata]|nr:hypothetical protein BDF22DRAFT_663945 [Syncephalis plumigaleata]